MFKKFRELFLILIGVNIGLFGLSFMLNSIPMMLLNLASAALLLLAYELNNDEE